MKTITIDILKTAFRKLLSATYYDKTDMVMRHRVATFARGVSNEADEEQIFGELLGVAEGKNEELLKKMATRNITAIISQKSF